MTTATIRSWGNSKGLIIPKQICDKLGLSVGDEVSITPDEKRSTIEIAPMKRKFARKEKLTSEEVFSGWAGTYSLPTDLQGDSAVGDEAGWGNSVGKEMW